MCSNSPLREIERQVDPLGSSVLDTIDKSMDDTFGGARQKKMMESMVNAQNAATKAAVESARNQAIATADQTVATQKLAAERNKVQGDIEAMNSQAGDTTSVASSAAPTDPTRKRARFQAASDPSLSISI